MDRVRLPRRDFVLLPAISLVTIAILFFGAELAARVRYPEQEADSCLVSDTRLGLKYRPTCRSQVKSFESDWVENRFNECGYRTDASCGPTPAGSLRVAVLGSSMALGFLVAQDESFASVASHDLTVECGRPVEFQNLGGYLIFWSRQIARIPDVLQLKPDAVLLEVAPFDLAMADPGSEPNPEQGETAKPQLGRNIVAALKELTDQSRALKVAQHAILQDESLYVSLYLKSAAKSAYMREPLDAFWQSQLDRYDQLLGRVADGLREHGIPLVLTFVPQRAQARVAAMGVPPPGVEPLLLNKLLREMAARHYVGFVDVTPDFIKHDQASDAEPLFFPIDGHLTTLGHALAGSAISAGFPEIVPAFAECRKAVISKVN